MYFASDPNIIEKIRVEEHTVIFNCESGNYEFEAISDQEVWVLEDKIPYTSFPINVISLDDETLLDNDFVLVEKPAG